MNTKLRVWSTNVIVAVGVLALNISLAAAQAPNKKAVQHDSSLTGAGTVNSLLRIAVQRDASLAGDGTSGNLLRIPFPFRLSRTDNGPLFRIENPMGGAISGIGGVSGVEGSGPNNGVHGLGKLGVRGTNQISGGASVYGDRPIDGNSWAGYFDGVVRVTGTLAKPSGSFEIDHPLDPANKYLYHSFIESPDMMNIYNGTATTDSNGQATVVLPDYFSALNRDFRYQLTVVGQFAQAIVGAKIADNSFTIKTDKPNVEVSWQVTGIRQDAWANAHRVQVEKEKSEKERGYYLHPTLFGQPEEKGIMWAHNPELMQSMKERREALPQAEDTTP